MEEKSDLGWIPVKTRKGRLRLATVRNAKKTPKNTNNKVKVHCGNYYSSYHRPNHLIELQQQRFERSLLPTVFNLLFRSIFFFAAKCHRWTLQNCWFWLAKPWDVQIQCRVNIWFKRRSTQILCAKRPGQLSNCYAPKSFPVFYLEKSNKIIL